MRQTAFLHFSKTANNDTPPNLSLEPRTQNSKRKKRRSPPPAFSSHNLNSMPNQNLETCLGGFFFVTT